MSFVLDEVPNLEIGFASGVVSNAFEASPTTSATLQPESLLNSVATSLGTMGREACGDLTIQPMGPLGGVVWSDAIGVEDALQDRYYPNDSVLELQMQADRGMYVQPNYANPKTVAPKRVDQWPRIAVSACQLMNKGLDQASIVRKLCEIYGPEMIQANIENMKKVFENYGFLGTMCVFGGENCKEGWSDVDPLWTSALQFVTHGQCTCKSCGCEVRQSTASSVKQDLLVGHDVRTKIRRSVTGLQHWAGKMTPEQVGRVATHLLSQRLVSAQEVKDAGKYKSPALAARALCRIALNRRASGVRIHQRMAVTTPEEGGSLCHPEMERILFNSEPTIAVTLDRQQQDQLNVADRHAAISIDSIMPDADVGGLQVMDFGGVGDPLPFNDGEPPPAEVDAGEEGQDDLGMDDFDDDASWSDMGLDDDLWAEETGMDEMGESGADEGDFSDAPEDEEVA